MADVSARLTPLGVMVLSLLRECDMHPYEMIRLARQRHDDRLMTITNGTLYHTVSRLEQLGWIAEVGVDREGNRPERTTYTLTDAGRDAATDWVRRELPRIDRPAEFRIALAEAHDLPRAEVIALLTERRAALAGDLDVHREGRRKAFGRGVLEQFLLEVERQTLLLDAELQWIDDLIDRLHRKTFPFGVDEFDDETIHRLHDMRRASLA